jgi:serine/threonine protein kinase
MSWVAETERTTVVLRTTSDFKGEDARPFQYYLDYTGTELIQAAVHNLGLPRNPFYQILVRDATGGQWWADATLPLRSQPIVDDFLIIVMIPQELQEHSETHQRSSVKHRRSSRRHRSSSVILPEQPVVLPEQPVVSLEQVVVSPEQPVVPPEQVVVSPEQTDLSPYYVDLSDYTKSRRLGAGAFGSVFLATHKPTGQQVAIKELSIDVSSPSQYESFSREVQILATVAHAALLGLHGCTRFTDAIPRIITPFMPGGSLQDVLTLVQRGQAPESWDWTRKLIALIGIASGMAYLHERRIIHRDLKPGNVLLDENMEPKVADFGLSKFVPEGQSRYQTMRGGTAQFMAPELYLGEDYDFKVDVYAFGVMMYMIVTGLEPFDDTRNQLVLARNVVGGQRPTIPGWVPPCCRDLIEQCWSTGPDTRPDFSQIVCQLGEDGFLVSGVDVARVSDYQIRISPEALRSAGSQSKRRRQHRSKDTHEVIPAGPNLADLMPEIPRNPIDVLREMANGGDAFAMVQFGRKLEKGEGVRQDVDLARHYFEAAAARGNLDALVWIGRQYYSSGDYERAAEHFKRAAHAEHLDGIYQYAGLLRFALGVDRDDVRAASLYKMAADQGHTQSQSRYGQMLEDGLGVARNVKEAVKYYQMAADQACREGMFHLATMYQNAKHVTRNMPEAIRLYRMAAMDGMAEAGLALIQIYRYGAEGIPANPAMAADFAQQSAERGSSWASSSWRRCSRRSTPIAPRSSSQRYSAPGGSWHRTTTPTCWRPGRAAGGTRSWRPSIIESLPRMDIGPRCTTSGGASSTERGSHRTSSRRRCGSEGRRTPVTTWRAFSMEGC